MVFLAITVKKDALKPILREDTSRCASLQPRLEIEGGGIHVSVDKLDGHVWTREDFLRQEKEAEDLEEELRWLVKKEQ